MKMERKILDDHLFLEEDKTVQPKLVNWTAILILWFGIVYSIANGLFFNSQLIVAIVVLGIATTTSFVHFKWGVKITLGIIVLGIFNVVHFFPVQLNFAVNDLWFGLDFVMIAMTILHYFTNKKQFSKSIKNFLNVDLPEKEVHAINRSKIESFKNRFSNKTIHELETMLDNPKLIPAAIKAAKELIEYKK